MEQIYVAYWKDIPLVLDIKIQKEGTQPPAGYTVLGQFTHPGELDELGYSNNHVIFHHLREMLYPRGRTDMSNLHAELILDSLPAVIHVTGVTATPTTLTLAPGATHQLAISVLPENASDKTFSCVSNTPAVATVSPTGLITAVAAGTATITVLTTDGGFDAESNITVKVAVASVAINPPASTELTSWGTWVTLTENVLPANATNKEVTWTSSAPAVLTHEGGGQFSPRGIGSATVTCASVDDPTKQATLAFTVVAAPVEFPDTLSTAPNDQGGAVPIEMIVTGEQNVEVAQYPNNATDSEVEAISSDTALATVAALAPGEGTTTNWKITAVAAGTPTITFRVKNKPTVSVDLKLNIT